MPLNLQSFISPLTSRIRDFLPDEEEKEKLRQQFQQKAISLAKFVKEKVFPKPELISPIPDKLISPLPDEPVTKPTPTPDPLQKMFDLGWREVEEKPTPTATPTLAPIPTPTPMPTPTAIPQIELGRNPKIVDYKITNNVNQAITEAGQKFDLLPTLLFDIALGESSFNPNLVNTSPEGKEAGNPTGLFQFTDNTWEVVKKFAKDEDSALYNLLPNFDRKDPVTNSLAAAYLIAFGQLGRWEASKGSWGEFYTDEELEAFYRQTLAYQQ